MEPKADKPKEAPALDPNANKSKAPAAKPNANEDMKSLPLEEVKKKGLVII